MYEYPGDTRLPPLSQRREFMGRLNVFVMATEEKAPVEWAAERILGLRKRRAYAILREIGAYADLEGWLRQRVLAGMESGRIGRGRQTRRSPLADAFLILGRGPSMIVSRRAEFPVAQRGPKWHTAPERRWLIPAL